MYRGQSVFPKKGKQDLSWKIISFKHKNKFLSLKCFNASFGFKINSEVKCKFRILKTLSLYIKKKKKKPTVKHLPVVEYVFG